MKINNIEMRIIPSPHQIYARGENVFLPVKELPSETQIDPFTEGETIRSIEQMVGRNIKTRRYVLQDPGSDKRYLLPINTSLSTANEIDTFDTGHEIMGFRSPEICARKYYSVDVDSN